MTKNSELLVMRACGISLYRTAAAAAALRRCSRAASLFVLQERVLASRQPRSRPARTRSIRGWPAATTALNRRWMVGTGGEMYHYDFFDQRANRVLESAGLSARRARVAAARGDARDRASCSQPRRRSRTSAGWHGARGLDARVLAGGTRQAREQTRGEVRRRSPSATLRARAAELLQDRASRSPT